MLDWFAALAPACQALLASLFTWAMTAAGAALVFFPCFGRGRLLPCVLGLAAGVMTAASFWSLLLPAAEMCESFGYSSVLLTIGFFLGGALLFVCDALFARSAKKAENRAAMLVFSVTLHNVPEGLCVGVAFGALAYGEAGGGIAAACLLALGIGLQNFPEGAAISLPLRSGGFTRSRAFFWGHISGAVEPASAVFGAFFVLAVRAALPFSLAFAAGAMIYVVAAELLPEGAERREATAIAAIVGFSVMMLMDTVFG